MRRTYSLIIEGAYVPELPTIVVTGKNIEDLTTSAKDAVRIYWETLQADRSPGAKVREIEVELPA